jgi:site-specific DNA-cytosine methylase
LSAIAVLALIAASIGSYYFGKRVGSNELLHEMELSMVDNVLIDSIEHIIATEAYADSAEKAALLEQRRNEYAIRKRALEFTRHSENIDVSARQRAREMSEAAIRQEAEYLKRMEAEKEANTEAEARQWAKEKQASQQKNNQQADAQAQAAKAKAEAEAKAAQERAAQQAKAQQPKPQQVSTPKPAAPAQTSGFNSAKYDQMNNQVRLGAYRIVGVDQTVTVRKGQSLQSISKSFLGPGMECYIEALNDGIKSVSEGQKLKIPKLELRKKANK